MNDINWDGLRYFVAAVEGGSLTAAARQLGSNQPTVGRHIDALEDALGLKLFQRSVKGLILTEEGTVIYEQARAMHTAVDHIRRYRQGEDKAIRGTVRVAIPEGLCTEVLAPLLPRFYQDYPDIHLILNVSSNTANLTRGEADIAVRLFRPKESSLVVKQLGRMTLGLFASAAYLQANGRPASPDELQHHRIISYGDGLSAFPENQWLLEHTAPSANVLSSDSTLTRLRATLAGIGISVQPTLFCRNNPDLIPVLDDTELPHHEIWITYHHDLRNLSRIRSVTDFISDNLAP